MASPAESESDEVVDAPARRVTSRHQLLRRTWPLIRVLLGLGVFALVFVELKSHRAELDGLSEVIRTLHWWWVPPALAAEAASLGCFAGLQEQLLRAGGLAVPLRPILKMTVASQALTNSLPGGTAPALVYNYRWYRRFGADGTLATWAIVGAVVASFSSLALVAVGGLALATGEGASLDLIPVLIGIFLFMTFVGAMFVYEQPLLFVVTWCVNASRSLVGRPRGDTAVHIERIVRWVTTVRLGWSQIRRLLAWGSANWLLDCSCFAMMFLAVGAPIPWKGLLLAYGAGQLAANLPITPGGLGAVEGSITIALVAFGGARVVTVEAVLMYRTISFWLVLVVGWTVWAKLAHEVRTGRWNRRALRSPVEAALVLELHNDETDEIDEGVRSPGQVGS
jgi:uncharacterized membrane protein YbhN (UPF0104 family)